MPPAGLTPRQRRFVEEYPTDFNASAASRRAGYSRKTAYAIGHKLLKNAEIQRAIQKHVRAATERVDISLDNVLIELARVGFSDITSVVEWDDSGLQLKDSTNLTDDDSHAVAEVRETQGRTSIRMHSKVQALTSLLAYFKAGREDSDRGRITSELVQAFRDLGIPDEVV